MGTITLLIKSTSPLSDAKTMSSLSILEKSSISFSPPMITSLIVCTRRFIVASEIDYLSILDPSDSESFLRKEYNSLGNLERNLSLNIACLEQLKSICENWKSSVSSNKSLSAQPFN
jgi:hypothetical protein